MTEINIGGKGYVETGGQPHVADWDVTTSSPDWNINIDTETDYYTWHPSFTATHALGVVAGDKDGNVIVCPNDDADREELVKAFNNAVTLELNDFNLWDI